MKYRKLFQAKDEHGDLHYIDNLEKDKISGAQFFCPHCDGRVQPKMGDKNVWHFSHIDRTCEKLRISTHLEENKKTKDIWSYTKKFIIGSDFKLDSGTCQCEFCRIIQSKNSSIKWSDDIYVCKDCYRQLNKEKIEHLQWKSMM